MQLSLFTNEFFSIWTPPNYPPNAVRTELYISGPEKNNHYLLGIISEIEPPLGRFDQPEDVELIYTSPDKARKVFEGLYEKLCGLYPELIGNPDGVMMEHEVLYFRGSEVFV